MVSEKQLNRVGKWLAGAKRILVITGAGISAESGIPTFRGADGYWKKHDVMTLASPEGFAANPALVWEWYAERIATVRAAEPNAGHRALVELERRVPEFILLTQNVDGLHRRAGSQNMHEIHGSILRARCMETDKIYSIDDLNIEPPFPVRTPEGNLARPDVVWFGEIIKMDAMEAVDQYFDADKVEMCLMIGTTGMFPYIQRWALQTRQRDGKLIEINPEPTMLADFCNEVLECNAGDCLPGLVEYVSKSTY